MRRGVRSTLEAVLLLALGLGCLWLSGVEAYARLMNPSFRPVTIGGALLVTAMGVALLVRPRRDAGAGALLVFLAFAALVALGRPLAPGVAPLLPSVAANPPMVDREGYVPLRVETLFETVTAEASDVEEGTYVFSGLVHRTPELDAEGVFVLLEPLMACCLADAIALGVRVQTTDTLPDASSWVHVFGELRDLPEPVETSPFRLGAILFTNVSRRQVVASHEVLPWRALLPNLRAKIPEDRCGRFLAGLDATGLTETLAGDGPFTVFAPLDLAFDRLDPAERDALFAPAGREKLRTLLERFVVPGHYEKDDLYGLEELETISGWKLRVEVVNGRVQVAGARILFGDQQARNGVLHIVHPGWV